MVSSSPGPVDYRNLNGSNQYQHERGMRRSDGAPSAGPGVWRLEAACRGRDTSLWFSRNVRDQAAAKAVCARCPVVAECGDAGRSEQGIWGGRVRRAPRRLFDDGYRLPPGPVTLGPEHPAHGRSAGYNQHRCRCAECRRWAREAKRAARAAAMSA